MSAAFYLELTALGLAVWTEGEGEEVSIKVSGLHALPEGAADQLRGRIKVHKPALLRLLLSGDPDAACVLEEAAAARDRKGAS